MATVTGYTAAHMDEIANTCIINGAVDLSGNLDLITRDGTHIAAGNIKGPQGIQGPAGDPTELRVRPALGDEEVKLAIADATPDNPIIVIRKDLWAGHGSRITYSRDPYTRSAWAETPQWAYWVAPTLTGPISNFGGTYAGAGYLKTGDGIVVLNGMISVSGGGSNVVLFVLPEEFRPDMDMIFPIVRQSTVYGELWVIAETGEVRVTTASNGWHSISGIMFPAAGVATWTPYTFTNNWTVYEVENWGTPAWWKDPWGRVWNRGMVRKTTGTPAADELITNTVAGNAPESQLHFAGATDSGFGGHDTTPASAGAIRWKSGGSTYRSLANLVWATNTGGFPAQTHSYLNSWTTYAGQPPARSRRFPDNLTMWEGLIDGGAFPSSAVTVGAGYRPRSTDRQLFCVSSANALGRSDWNTAGNLEGVTGDGAWFSLAGINYVLEG